MNSVVKRRSRLLEIKVDLKKNWILYLMILVPIIYFVMFHYLPMVGAQIAFRNFKPKRGIWGSEWVGLKHFLDFFNSYYFWRVLRNTLVLSGLNLLFGFPAPIILALLLNEIQNRPFKKVVQTVSYMPHFISVVVICGMLVDFCSVNGLFNTIIEFFGGKPTALLGHSKNFRFIYIASEIWRQVGWNSIIYMASISNIDQQLYEAAKIDGAGRFRQTMNVTLPGILPMAIMLLIMQVGRMMTLGADKILLLYNPATYETSDIISTFVYRKGILEANYSYSTAVGLFNSVVNFILLLSVNAFSRKVSETSLW